MPKYAWQACKLACKTASRKPIHTWASRFALGCLVESVALSTWQNPQSGHISFEASDIHHQSGALII